MYENSKHQGVTTLYISIISFLYLNNVYVNLHYVSSNFKQLIFIHVFTFEFLISFYVENKLVMLLNYEQISIMAKIYILNLELGKC